MSKVIVTGGCGYIGTHTLVDLINKGFDVISIDNYTDNLSEVKSFESFQRNDMFEDQLLNFIKLINSDAKFDKALKDSIGGHKIAMAIKESLSSGSIVNF